MDPLVVLGWSVAANVSTRSKLGVFGGLISLTRLRATGILGATTEFLLLAVAGITLAVGPGATA